MPGLQPLRPVMHTVPLDALGNYELGLRVKNGLYSNPVVFVNPPVADTVFNPALDLLGTLITDAKGNTPARKNRDAQSKIVHKYLSKLCKWSDPICDGVVDTIILSGFGCTRTSEKQSPPEQPVIEKIVKGKEIDTYKVFLKRKAGKKFVEKDSKTHPRGVTYAVLITLSTDDPNSWKTVVSGKTRNQLTFKDYTQGKKNYVKVIAMNTAGVSQPSEIFSFTPAIE